MYLYMYNNYVQYMYNNYVQYMYIICTCTCKTNLYLPAHVHVAQMDNAIHMPIT